MFFLLQQRKARLKALGFRSCECDSACSRKLVEVRMSLMNRNDKFVLDLTLPNTLRRIELTTVLLI